MALASGWLMTDSMVLQGRVVPSDISSAHLTIVELTFKQPLQTCSWQHVAEHRGWYATGAVTCVSQMELDFGQIATFNCTTRSLHCDHTLTPFHAGPVFRKSWLATSVFGNAAITNYTVTAAFINGGPTPIFRAPTLMKPDRKWITTMARCELSEGLKVMMFYRRSFPNLASQVQAEQKVKDTIARCVSLMIGWCASRLQWRR